MLLLVNSPYIERLAVIVENCDVDIVWLGSDAVAAFREGCPVTDLPSLCKNDYITLPKIEVTIFVAMTVQRKA